jgi:16S rRNA (guanine1207-N2)-methyltransferase
MGGVAKPFSLDRITRFPDPAAHNLVAVDATDRLLLAGAAPDLAAAAPGQVVIIQDAYGALTLGAAALHGAAEIRVHQDRLVGERALARNAELQGLEGCYRQYDLGSDLLSGAHVVLLQLPKSLAALQEIAEAIARFAAPEVVLFAGGRVKHMALAMNDVLRAAFGDVQPGLAHQKSRLLRATGPLVQSTEPGFPARQIHADLDLWVCAHGAAFGGTKVDIGTRFLLSHLDAITPSAGSAVDLGCGTGILATVLARSRPTLSVLASDQSAAAVASAAATAAANGVGDRVRVQREDALETVPSESIDVVVCNPPFHLGTALQTRPAWDMFTAAARVLRPGGQLFTVFNTHLAYEPALRAAVGSTRVAGRNAKFTVTVSTR